MICKRGHVDAGRTKSNNCTACEQERSKARSGTPAHAAASRLWRQRHPELAGESCRVWRSRYPEKKNAYDSWRRALIVQRTPLWSDSKKIQILFREASRIQSETGIRMSVDHVIPLKGEAVSGLHVFENLRVLPLIENTRKTNSYRCV